LLLPKGKNLRLLFIVMALALMLAAGNIAFADAGAAPTDKPEKKAATPADNPAFKKFLDEGGRMEFLGNAYGLDGWLLIHKDNKLTTIYTTPEGGLIKGGLFDPSGQPVTAQQIQAFQARMNGAQGAVPGAERGGASKAETVYAKVEKANWVRVGSKDAPYLYMFINVGCAHCQELWKKLQPAVKAGTLQLRIVPFGEKELNRDGGAALLSVDKPGDAWQEFIDGKQDSLASDKIKGDARKQIDANTKLVQQTGIPGPLPFTIYRKLTDGTVTAIVGEPDNIMVVQADLMKNN
jgi:thiol:disulfide interchange protein DsbG